MICLKFEKGDSLKIHRDLLHRTPKLAKLAAIDVVDKIDPRTGMPVLSPQAASLKDISRSAGHVLVQYLYTDNYRTLKWVGPTDTQKQTVTMVEVAFEVYATAREFDLTELEALATEEITLLSKDVDPFTIIDIVKKTYPCAKGNDTWFPIFIKDTIRTAFETPLGPPPAETTTVITLDDALVEVHTPQDVTLAKLLLQGALEVYREKIDALTVKPTPKPFTGTAPLFGSSSTAMNNSNKTTGLGGWSSSWNTHTAEPGVWSFGGTKETTKEEKPGESVLESVDPEPVSVEEVKQDVPDPKKAEAVDDFTSWGATSKKDKKKKKYIIAEPEPEPEKKEDDDIWGAFSKKKKKKAKSAELELELLREPEPEPEPEVIPEPEPEDLWGGPPKKKKKDKRAKLELELLREPEPEPEPEVIPEPEPERVEDDHFWGAADLKKKKKKGKKADSEPEPERERVEEPEVMADPAPAISPVAEGWVGDGPDPWAYWGAKKSPRPSM